jgi:sulfite reductase (NADPH) flavoprotein alpha-component
VCYSLFAIDLWKWPAALAGSGLMPTKDTDHNMNLTQRWPANTPLTDAQSSQLATLAGILTPEQSLWVSGYLAGLAAGQRQTAEAPSPKISTVTAVDRQQKLTIVYASETGNARTLATSAGEMAAALGLNFRIVDIADFKTRTLRDESHLLFITSTHGEGDPPESAFSFHEFLFGRKAPTLSGTKYAVLGLGDQSYEHFCKTARSFDEKLEELGGQRVHPRVECDVDYDEMAGAWLRDTLAAFSADAGLLQARQDAAPTPVAAAASPQLSASRYDQFSPFSATIIDRVVLNGRGSDKTTYHIELALEDSGLTYAPGDALGVVAINADEAVDEVLDALGFNGAEEIRGGDTNISLRTALLRDFELTIATPRFLQAYAEACGSGKLQRLADSKDRAALFDYLRQRQILDIISEYPALGITAPEFVAMLRKLTPRLYSLASSQLLLPDEAHLTVAQVRFSGRGGRERYGVASGMLGRLSAAGESVQVYIARNDEFRLPADPAAPVIMVGAGTGVAPYRAFLQEREALEIKSPSWLIFGDRHFRTDFLYQTDWQQFRKEGYLSRMDVAFSRDGGAKIYVQHRMLEHACEMFNWLERGAHFYVCGDAANLAPDVHQALIDVVVTGGGKSRDAAEAYVSIMREEKRYRRDVY